MSTLAHPSILFVEDDNIQCRICVATIKGVFNGADVTTAAKMDEAWDKMENFAAEKKLPDLILADVYLGEAGKDGLDFLKKLKEDARFKDITVVMYSAYLTEDKKLELLTAGAEAVFDKPLKNDMIEGWAKYFG